MGKKIIITATATAQLIVSIIIFSVMYTYLYPWIYNKVNHFTERGQDLDDKIDIINAMIMALILYLFTCIIIFGTGGIIFAVSKITKKSKK